MLVVGVFLFGVDSELGMWFYMLLLFVVGFVWWLVVMVFFKVDEFYGEIVGGGYVLC